MYREGAEGANLIGILSFQSSDPRNWSTQPLISCSSRAPNKLIGSGAAPIALGGAESVSGTCTGFESYTHCLWNREHGFEQC